MLAGHNHGCGHPESVVLDEHDQFTLVVFQQGSSSDRPRRSFSFGIEGNAVVGQVTSAIAAAIDVPQWQVQLWVDGAPVATTSWVSQFRASRRRIDFRIHVDAPGPCNSEYSPFLAPLPALLAE